MKCGGVINQADGISSGEFTSVAFGVDTYPNHEYCVWTFNAVPGFRVLITMREQQTESYDNIFIYDGPNTGSTKIARFKTSSKFFIIFRINENFFSLSGQLDVNKQSFVGQIQSLTVVFSADGSIVNRGFRASYEFGILKLNYFFC